MTQNRAPETWGLISIYTGDGKGKTTAALGVLVRALGAGKKVVWVSFDKGGKHYSERQFLRASFPENLTVAAFGLDRIDPLTNRFRFGVLETDVIEATNGWRWTIDCAGINKPDLLILDEINTTVVLGMLPQDVVINFLRTKPATLEVILTGRQAPAAFVALADLVTEMRSLKHYLNKGVSARKGVDY